VIAMALSAVRQRRSEPSDPSPSEPYTKLDKPEKAEEKDEGLGWVFPFVALGLLRYMSATSNIIHDCDEVFNYWEPLHFLLYKTGFQTWEYRFCSVFLSFLFFVVVGVQFGEDGSREKRKSFDFYYLGCV